MYRLLAIDALMTKKGRIRVDKEQPTSEFWRLRITCRRWAGAPRTECGRVGDGCPTAQAAATSAAAIAEAAAVSSGAVHVEWESDGRCFMGG